MMPATTRERGRLRFSDEQVEQANNVNLLELARQYGYELEDTERKAFHAKHSDYDFDPPDELMEQLLKVDRVLEEIREKYFDEYDGDVKKRDFYEAMLQTEDLSSENA